VRGTLAPGIARVVSRLIYTYTLITLQVRGILAVPGIARVVFDLTAKPPGTTEWE